MSKALALELNRGTSEDHWESFEAPEMLRLSQEPESLVSMQRNLLFPRLSGEGSRVIQS